MAGSTRRLALRFYQIKTGHCLSGSASTGRRAGPPRSAGGAGTGFRLGSTSSRCVSGPEWKARRKILWGGEEGD